MNPNPNMTVSMFLICPALPGGSYEERVQRWYETWRCGIIEADVALTGIENEKRDDSKP